MRTHSCLRMTLVAMSLTALPFSGMSATSDDAIAEANNAEVNIWVDAAPLTVVLRQLGEMSALEMSIDGEFEEPVSGRFNGSLQETLARLASTHGILFDRQGDTLHAAQQSDSSSVSIALTGQALEQALEGSLADVKDMWPGNSVEFRQDALRISGHPDFVSRTARQLTTQIASLGGKAQDAARTKAISLALDSAESVVDAGSLELLQDIQEENKPESERASLSKPIRWVTDIPGFNTF